MTTPVLLVCLGGMFVAVWALGFLMGRARSGEKVVCPSDGKSRDVVLERRLDLAWDVGRPSDVVACSAFEDGGDVSCPKGCMADCARPGTPIH